MQSQHPSPYLCKIGFMSISVFFLHLTSSFLSYSFSSYRFTLDDNLTEVPPLPRVRSLRGTKNCMMESSGALLFFSRPEMNVLQVYEAKEIESGWTNKYEVDMSPISDVGFETDHMHFMCDRGRTNRNGRRFIAGVHLGWEVDDLQVSR